MCKKYYHHHCSIQKKPISSKKCCTVKYVSTWSPVHTVFCKYLRCYCFVLNFQCSSQCGVGIRKKEFNCAKVFKPERKGSKRKKVVINSQFCSKLRLPLLTRSRKSCKVNCKWVVQNWTPCHGNCSVHYQTRSVSCEANGRNIPAKHCDVSKKPVYKKVCNNCIRHEYKITKVQHKIK